MDKIAVITDSSCDIDIELLKKYNIKILPLRVIYKDGEYRDGIDITSQEMYNRLEYEIPTTSMPSPGDVHELLTNLQAEGYTKILAITISSGLSGTFQLVKMVASEFSDLEMEVIDSKSLSMGLGFLVLTAVEELTKGNSLIETAEKVRALVPFTKVYYVLETLEYLRKGGRIGLVAATLGSFLDLKPIISINEEGKYFTFDKVRGRKKSIRKLVEIVQETASSVEQLKVAVMHGDALAEAEKLVEEIKQAVDNIKIEMGQITPTLAVHTGPGLLGVICMPLK